MSISNYSPVIITSDSPVPFIPSLVTVPAYPTFPSLPIISSVNPIISFPLHPSLDLNRDHKLHEMMTKYFYYKTLDKWLKREKDMLDLLKYFKINNGNVELTGGEQNTNDDQKTIDKKIDFIEKNILSKDDIYNILKKYVRETSTNWYDLEDKATYFIKEIIKKFIKNKIKDVMASKRSNNRF